MIYFWSSARLGRQFDERFSAVCSKQGGALKPLLLVFAVVGFVVSSFSQNCELPNVGSMPHKGAQYFDAAQTGVEQARAIARDSAGNIYVTGTSPGSSNSDIVTIKYDKNLSQLWSHRWDGGHGNDVGTGIAVDGGHNVYVCGRSVGSGSNGDDAIVLRYEYNVQTQDYSLSHTRRYHHGHGADGLNAIALDGLNSLYAVGFVTEDDSTKDALLMKLDRSDLEFSEDWPLSGTNPDGMRIVSGPASGHDELTALAVDNERNVAAVGYAHVSGGSSGHRDYLTVRYELDGDEGFVEFWGSQSSVDDIGYAVTTDSSRNVYATGHREAQTIAGKVGTIKYEPDGDVVWSHELTHQDWDGAAGLSMTLDPAGYVNISGWVKQEGREKEDLLTVQYCLAPNPVQEQWWRIYEVDSGDGSLKSIGTQITVDSDGHIYVAGHGSIGSSSDRSLIVLKYSRCGDFRWGSVYSDESELEFSTATVMVATSDPFQFYVAGYPQDGSNEKYLVVQYCLWKGDIDASGEVDDTDLSTVLGCFGEDYAYACRGENGTPANCHIADVNQDGVVDDDA